MAKSYSVRKMGMRRGNPHYGSECNLCRRILVVAHLSKEAATAIAKNHVAKNHNL